MKESNKYWIRKNFLGFAYLVDRNGKRIKASKTSGFCVDYVDEDVRRR